ncbi:NosD domain-containing protein [Halomicrobium urmianum]|uniref:NosD domain-containing protein n=1 Tax=Halomicrobium urmianum TaxID=1586233 RepID=UPI001CD9988C|nr:NosD domain-containing protein [Halomicrobium urmianum]
MDVRYPLAVVALTLLLFGTAFAVQPGGAELSPVPFDETLSMGMTGLDVRAAEHAGYALPRAQAFYSQYQYVIGYYGLEAAASHLDSGQAQRQFGQPLGVFVTEFSGAGLELTPEGYLVVTNDPGVGWIRAERASYVVDGAARTTAGPAVVPFETDGDAESFADEHGGRVVDWETVRAEYADRDRAGTEQLRSIRENRTRWADDRVADSRDLLDRPRSVVVGEDAPTLADAVDRAPPNTTVYLPPGTYESNVTVTKPLTVRGAGDATVVDGGGDDRVIRANASRVAVADLRIRGVGPVGVSSPTGNASGWDSRVELAYGRGDAAVLFSDAERSLVADVAIETPSNGVLVRYSPGTVVRNVTVDGADDWRDGFMGVLTMYSPTVVQNATVRGGRDGVYTHRSHGTVVRNSDMRGLRYGVHEMYTSGTLVADNAVADAEMGVVVMTRPRGNVIADNDVRDSGIGVSMAGDASYVVGNVLVDNRVGMSAGATRSLYTRNTVVGNDRGIRADTIVPTNVVVANDVAGNGQPAPPGSGPVHVWTSDGRGNYWADARGLDRDGDGTLDRIHRPSSRVDRTLGRSPAGTAMSRAPAFDLFRGVQSATPGLRRSAVVDTAPLADPVRPEVLAEVNES